MTIKKKASLVFVLFFCLYISSLAVFSILHMDFWGYLCSPLGTLASGLILLYYYVHCRDNFLSKSVWLCLSLACFLWMIADLLYFILYAAGKSTSNLLLSFLYPFANLMIACGCLFLSINLFKQWNWLQYLLDCIIFTLCAFRFLWLQLFDKFFSLDELIEKYGVFSALSVIMDLMIFVGIILWVLGIKRRSRSIPILITCFGATLFAANNIYYGYLYVYGMYKPQTIVDVLYIAGLILMSCGPLYELNHPNETTCMEDYALYAHKYKYNRALAIFIFPVITVVFKGFIASELLIYLFLTDFYLTCTVYIKIGLKNEELLRKEKELNRTLEEKVRQRTGELIEKNRALDQISKQDTVTKLYNRRYFVQELQKRIEALKETDRIVLFFIDLDRFKTINDTYGHLVGDEVLIEISKRLQLWNRADSVLARLGGDEFVLAVSGRYGYRQAENIAKRIIRYCSEDIEIDEYIFRITMSVGISLYPVDAHNINFLMKNADIAMYRAKEKGFNQYVSFNSLLDESSRRKNKIEMLLKQANFDKEFKLYFQPQFQIPGSTLIGIETLLRWTTPDGEVISPAEFIPIAEEIDYIIPIGEWVMHRAIRKIAKWNTMYHTHLKMGINVSPKQLDNKNFISVLKNSIHRYKVDPDWLDVEITENIAMEGKHRLTQVATMFNEMGISISIDDFGTGYSSLSYLKYFPFDRIKISKPLIDAICEHNYDLQIVKAIILLSKSLGIKTIAEGVETQNQLDILTNLGCEQIQGFYYSEPLPSSEFEKRFLIDGRFCSENAAELSYTI